MIDTNLIPDSNLDIEIDHEDGNTQDIINSLLADDKENDKRFKEFAAQFEPTRRGLKELWYFVRHKIKYQTDGFGMQDIKQPAALWKIGYGDCKSKTLFITQIFKLLGISYIIRFTAPRKDTDIKHVYPVAILNGKEIVVDSVYTRFDSEANFAYKKDYMAKIRSISGVEYLAGCTSFEEEVQQRKAYVQPQAPINFAKHTLAQARLKLLERKLMILSTMRDDLKEQAEEGINLVRNALKNACIPQGYISDNAQGIAQRINYLVNLQGGATGHGNRVQAAIFNYHQANTGKSIGNAPFMDCVAAREWFLHSGGTGTPTDPYQYLNANHPNFTNACSSSQADIKQGIQGNSNVFFSYGRSTKFRTSGAEFWNDFNAILSNFVLNTSTVDPAGRNFYNLQFQNQATRDLLQEALQTQSPVLSNWLEDVYKADSTRTDGTVGTALYYSAIDKINDPNININSFPSAVVVKRAFQRQYIGACSNFTTIAESIIDDMAENCFLFDTGGAATPVETLKSQLQKYSSSIALLDPVTATLIIGLVTAAISGGVKIAISAMDNAKLVDTVKQDTASFPDINGGTIPDPNDFLKPSTGSGNSNSNTNTNNGNTTTTGMSNAKKFGLAIALGLGAKKAGLF
jgi:hypothetical protein